MRVLLFAPAVPPYGGMALQAQQLLQRLSADQLRPAFLATNFPLPSPLGPLNRVPGLRTSIRAALVWPRLWFAVRRVDVVHVFAASWWYFFLSVVPAVVVGRIRRKRVVLNYRGGQAAAFFRQWGWLAAPVFRLADVVTAPSEFVAGLIRDAFAIPVDVVPNVVNGERFSFRARRTLTPRLLVTRHLEKPYDIESVLRAFQLVQAQHPQASLWIAGSGSEERQLRGLAAEWRLRNVRFLGAVRHGDLPKICDQCDIYVNASRIDNFPGALLEASAAGLPVVTTGAGGIPLMYEHRRTGWLVEPGDWRGLADGVLALLREPGIALAMAQAASEMARACAWPEVKKRLFAAYGIHANQAENHVQPHEAGCELIAK